MQIIIKHILEKPLTLPINYNYIVQAAIYNQLRQSGWYSTFLHNGGYNNQNRQYKLFTFGMLKGQCRIANGKITFYDTVELEVRGVEAIFVNSLRTGIEKNGIRYADTLISPENIEICVSDKEVETTDIVVAMNSPMVLYSTDYETKKTYYYSPMDEEFESVMNNNLVNKYKAYTGIDILSNIEVTPLEVDIRDKVVTKYKGFYITGWRGKYELSGDRKILDFLYQVGIGGKNSQGFGMFDIVE